MPSGDSLLYTTLMIDTKKYKIKLEVELARLDAELKTVGRKNPTNPDDWEPVPSKMDTDPADENEVADSIEEFEDNAGILKQLEIQYNVVKDALKRISENKFGVCGVCKNEIEADRLNANPSATTCKKHM